MDLTRQPNISFLLLLSGEHVSLEEGLGSPMSLPSIPSSPGTGKLRKNGRLQRRLEAAGSTSRHVGRSWGLCSPVNDNVPLLPTHRFTPRAASRQEKGSSAWVTGRGCKSAELWTPSDPVLSGKDYMAAVSEGKAAGGEKTGSWRGVHAGGQSPSAGASRPELSPAPCPVRVRGDLRARRKCGKALTYFLMGSSSLGTNFQQVSQCL